jgi:hypothetical protein
MKNKRKEVIVETKDLLAFMGKCRKCENYKNDCPILKRVEKAYSDNSNTSSMADFPTETVYPSGDEWNCDNLRRLKKSS